MAIRDMVARHMDKDEDDFVPTPGFATRALYEYAAPELKANAHSLSAWDPSAGRGHMTEVMEEYGHPVVFGTDIKHHGDVDTMRRVPGIEDFLTSTRCADVIITNPPYKHLNGFLDGAIERAKYGVAMLVRMQALESETRYAKFFKSFPPTQIAFFANRIPFKKDVTIRKAPKMFFHTWLWWNMSEARAGRHAPRPPVWVPYNVQNLLEKVTDYDV